MLFSAVGKWVWFLCHAWHCLKLRQTCYLSGNNVSRERPNLSSGMFLLRPFQKSLACAFKDICCQRTTNLEWICTGWTNLVCPLYEFTPCDVFHCFWFLFCCRVHILIQSLQCCLAFCRMCCFFSYVLQEIINFELGMCTKTCIFVFCFSWSKLSGTDKNSFFFFRDCFSRDQWQAGPSSSEETDWSGKREVPSFLPSLLLAFLLYQCCEFSSTTNIVVSMSTSGCRDFAAGSWSL